MRTEQTQKLIDKYQKYSQIFENDTLKSLLHTEILELYSEIENPNTEDNYTMGLFHYGDYNEKTSKDLLDKHIYTAISFFEKSIKSDSNYYMSYYYLGHCYQDLGQYKQAITYYLKVNQNQLKADFSLWRSVLLFELIGFCYWKTNQKDIGMNYFERTCSEYLKLEDYYDLFPIGDLIEECLSSTHSLVLRMKGYAEVKNSE